MDSPSQEHSVALPAGRDRALPFNTAELIRVALAPALALAGVAVALITQFVLTRGDMPNPALGFIPAVLLFAAAAFVLRRQRISDAEALAAFELPRYWEYALLAGVIALALFFRFFRFMEWPPGLWYDEAVNGVDAFSIIDRDHITVWRESNFGHSTIFFYLLIVSYKLFGYTVFAMRLVPAVAGMAAVIAFYFLARWLLGPIPALVATALLAVSRFAVTFSRVSWEASLQPLFEILAVYFFVRAIETKRTLYFVLAGGALAAGIYTYLAFRFVPVVLLFFLVYIGLTQRELLLRNVRGLLVYAAAFLIVLAPLAQYALQNQDQFLARTRDINVFKEIDKTDSYAPLRHNIRATLEMMNAHGDTNGRHNLPGAPMLDEVSAALLVLGLAVCAWSIRNWRKGGMAGWLALALVPGALTISIENPSAIRAVGAIPPLFLIPGLAVAFVYRSLAPTVAGRIVFGVLAVALVGGSAAINYDDFFNKYPNSKAAYDAFGAIPTQVAQLAVGKSSHMHVFVSREFNGHPAFLVLTRGKHIDFYTPATNISLPNSDRDYLLVLDPRQLAMLPSLRTLYPNLTTADDVDRFGRLQFTKVAIPATDVAAAHRVSMTVAGARNASPAAAQEPLARTWTQTNLAGGPLTATWEGNLWVNSAPGNVAFHLNSPGNVALEVDGKQVASGTNDVDVAAMLLGMGEHKVRVIADVNQPGDTTMKISLDGHVSDASDVLYGGSLGSRGFQAVYRTGRDLSAQPSLVTRIPFAVSALALPGTQSVDYRGLLDVKADGDYGFALDTGIAAQILVDDQLVVDSGGVHAPRRTEGSAALTAGPHLVSVQFTGTDRAEWAFFLKPPGEDWHQADGAEFVPPTGAFVAPVVVTLAPDPAWGANGRKIQGIDAPAAAAVMPDGTAVIAGAKTLAFVKPDGSTRTLNLDVTAIADLDVTPDGRIAVLDYGARSLLVIDADGNIKQRFDGAFSTAAGVAVQGEFAYVTSPSGGIVYKVPLGGGTVETLAISSADATKKAVQPSDISVAPDGTLFIADFDRRKIVISADGVTGRTVSGVPGTGTQVPHTALYRGVLFVTDPLDQRIVMYDKTGKQRGVYVFSSTGTTGARPVGIAATPDGLLYAADPENGIVYRLKITLPPDAPELNQ